MPRQTRERGFFEHHPGQIVHQTVLFDDAEEGARRQDALLRMTPAHQRFGADNDTGGEIDLGLEIGHELLLFHAADDFAGRNRRRGFLG